jgi:hypothetical protein
VIIPYIPTVYLEQVTPPLFHSPALFFAIFKQLHGDTRTYYTIHPFKIYKPVPLSESTAFLPAKINSGIFVLSLKKLHVP